MAIVGTRNVSAEGAARSRRLARELVAAGVVVASGLAKGVDTEALSAAIEAGGSVIAVIGTPIDRAYPAENMRLQERIYREHLLISPFPPGERVYPSNFPERNKLMAALSDATAIIEAGDTSGTLHQAAECLRLGRWLFIAKTVADDPSLQWPKRFKEEPTVRTLTVTQDVLSAIGTFGRYYGLKGIVLEQGVARCLDWSTLTDRAHELVKNLSGGMKRRLNMAVGLIHQPKLVLMDEPTVGVDPQSRHHIFEMIEKLRDEGMSLIYTTHYMEEAERLCDRIAIVDHGKIIELGTNDDLVRNAFGTRSQVLARFGGSPDRVVPWVAAHGGQTTDGIALFTISHPVEIASLLEDSANAGLELVDVSLRKPNLESVFLQLTGRELRD